MKWKSYLVETLYMMQIFILLVIFSVLSAWLGVVLFPCGCR
jgi:hypothetical protein